MNDLRTTTKLVKTILEEHPQTRNSDNLLYVKVLEQRAEENGVNLYGISIPLLLLNMKDYGFPGFETVRRTRQKLQATYPELAACENVQLARMENEKVFRGYALEHLEGGSYEN